MDSDAVFHGESESIIGFLIWLNNSELALILREKYDFCSCKMTSYALIVFGPFLHENKFWWPTFLIQKWLAQKTLQTLKVLLSLDVVAELTGEIPWIHPISDDGDSRNCVEKKKKYIFETDKEKKNFFKYMTIWHKE